MYSSNFSSHVPIVPKVRQIWAAKKKWVTNIHSQFEWARAVHLWFQRTLTILYRQKMPIEPVKPVDIFKILLHLWEICDIKRSLHIIFTDCLFKFVALAYNGLCCRFSEKTHFSKPLLYASWLVFRMWVMQYFEKYGIGSSHPSKLTSTFFAP